MKHTLILVIKFISCYVAFSLGLDIFFNADFVEIATFSLLLTIVTYLIGDRILLPRIGNSNALVIDFFVAYICVWIFGPILLNSYLQVAWGSIISALIITGAEVLVHRYLLKKLTFARANKSEENSHNPKPVFGMEVAEEQDPLEKK